VKGELSGWMEIADYLGFPVQVLHDFESELGLPIRRVRESKKSRIWADRRELDKWMEGLSKRSLADVLGTPKKAEFLFYLFMAPQNCDALVGDLAERYKLIYKKFGRRRADFWYWTQTAMSLGPIVWAWAKKVILKPVIAVVGWAVARGLLAHDSWLAALVELYRKIRS